MNTTQNPSERMARVESIIERLLDRVGVIEARPAAPVLEAPVFPKLEVPSFEPSIIGLTAEIVSAYVSRNAVPLADLSKLIGDTYHAIAMLDAPKQATPPFGVRGEPAVPIKKSITDDFLICLEDGKKFKSLKRHLWTHYGLTPEAYREKWGLQKDYPMTAPKYSEQRSALAKQTGLGKRRPEA